MSKNELVTRQAEPGPLAPAMPVRATRVASWVGWHLFEITGVTVPAVVAVAGTPWWWLVSGVVGAGWTANEIRVTQARRRGSVDDGNDGANDADRDVSDADETSGVDSERAGGVR